MRSRVGVTWQSESCPSPMKAKVIVLPRERSTQVMGLEWECECEVEWCGEGGFNTGKEIRRSRRADVADP